MCRATERFPDPGQVLGLTRFDENWIPVNARTVFNYTGFSLEKVKYGIHSTLRSWYRTKQDVHPDDITDPNYIWPKHLSSNMFLEVVHGRVTHVGCGISVFIEFDYAISKEHTVNLFHHVVRVICNLSSRIDSTPREDRVYTTDPPTHPGYTVKCGCPLGYDEDEDCLCYEVAENCVRLRPQHRDATSDRKNLRRRTMHCANFRCGAAPYKLAMRRRIILYP
ncbi:uncharacterized protein [Maniola hyperantus]|uniref:uncharacterized protein n=1 Tax=Aphantopus hyperantus TaxID=2795564 RepID=UPI003748C79A